MTETLIHRIKQKEKKAQEEFYKKYSPQMFRLVYRYVKNESDASDVLNMGFFKIFTGINRFIYTSEISFQAWMKKIIVNESLMFLRKENRFISIDKCCGELFFDEAEYADNGLMIEDYYFLIRQLPLNLRTVFNLYAIDGYSHNEIANELNISESSSRVYLMRARDILRKCLTGVKFDYEKL